MGAEFSELEKKIIGELVYYGYYKSGRRGRPEDIYRRIEKKKEEKKEEEKKGVKDKKGYVLRRLPQIASKLAAFGVEIEKTKSSDFNEEVYWINPMHKQRLISEGVIEDAKRDTRAIYLGELGWGTIASDPLAGKGLNAVLTHNKPDGKGRKSILESTDIIILNGGGFAFVPPFYSERMQEYMHLLSKRHGISEEDIAEDRQRITENFSDPEMREFMLKHAAGKILTLKHTQMEFRHNLETIVGKKFKGEIHYIMGDEDDENRKYAKELKITELGKTLQFLSKTDEKINNLQEKLDGRLKEADAYLKQAKILESIFGGSRIEDIGEEALKVKVSNYVSANRSELDSLKQSNPDAAKELAMALDTCSVPIFKKLIKEVRDNNKKYSEIIRDIQGEIKSFEKQKTAKERESEAAGFFNCTKRKQIAPDELAAIHKLAEIEYEKLYKEAGENYKFYVHPEKLKDITINGWVWRVRHNANQNSNAPLQNALDRLISLSSIEQERGFPYADVHLASHSKTGFVAQFLQRRAETLAKGKFTETPITESYMVLPKFLCEKAIGYIQRNKLLRNWLAKMEGDNVSALGAVVHTLRENGQQEIEYFSTDLLIKAGLVAQELEVYQEALKDDKLGKKEKEAIGNEIKKLERKLKIGSIRGASDEPIAYQIQVFADVHIGSETLPGRLSNYDILESYLRLSEKQEVLPRYIVTTEMLHGDISIGSNFVSGMTSVQLLRNEYESVLKKIRQEDCERAVALMNELHLMLASYAVKPHIDVQLQEFKNICGPYITRVLEAGGEFIIPSGNHLNKSTRGKVDEAGLIKSVFDPRYENQIIAVHGRGRSTGTGSYELHDGRILFVAHALRGGKNDQLTPAMKGMINTRQNMDVAIIGDKHQASAGSAYGKIWIMPPGMQAYNTYVPEIFKPPSVRGGVTVLLSENPIMREYFKTTWIFEDTLRRNDPELEARVSLQKALMSYLPKS